MELIDRVQEIMKRAVDTKSVAGVNLLVRVNDEEILYAEEGFADIEKKKPMRRDTIFRMFSMSKPVTSAATMILFERGLIDLLEPVGDYLPSFKHMRVFDGNTVKPCERPIFIRDLLDMTAGLSYPDGSTPTGIMVDEVFKELDGRLRTDHEMTTRELADRLAAIPLDFEPESNFKYSTCADILGALIEEVSGMKYSEFLKKEIFDPLGMEDTGFFVPAEKLDRLASGYQTPEAEDGTRSLRKYDWNNLGINNIPDHAPGFESGGAGLVSTLDDYARFTQMLLNEGELDGARILSPSTVRFMTGRRLEEHEQKMFLKRMMCYQGFTYSNLLRICIDEDKAGYICSDGEYGWDGWLGTYMANLPYEGVSILMGTQKVDSGTFDLTRKLRNVILTEILADEDAEFYLDEEEED